MTEIDVTHYAEMDPKRFCASVAEAGPDAARITWGAALAEAKNRPALDTPDRLDAMRAYLRDVGAWPEGEVNAWAPEVLEAMLIQEVAAAMRDPSAGWRLGTDISIGRTYFFLED